MKFSRRTAMQIAGTAALMPCREGNRSRQVPMAPKEGKDTPKIAIAIANTGLFGAPAPWSEDGLNAAMAPWKAEGIAVGNLTINLSNDILYGKPGNKRDEDIEKIKQSMVAAGKVGMPVVEYNFYAHRAMEGYFEEIDTDRGKSGWTGFDYELTQTAAQQYQTKPEEKGMKFKDELELLQKEGGDVGLDFQIAEFCLTLALSFLAGILFSPPPDTKPKTFIVFVVLVVVGFLGAVIFGIRWYRSRSSFALVIKRIRERQMGPLGESGAELKPSQLEELPSEKGDGGK
jgi:hypothetical protein